MGTEQSHTLHYSEKDFAEKLILCFYNDRLLEQGKITESEHQQMLVKINQRARAAGLVF